MRTLAVFVFLAAGVLTIPFPLHAIPLHDWSKRFGDGDFQGGYSVTADGSGNVIIVGSMSGTVDFGGGPLTGAGGYDIFIAKFDSDGSHLWSKRFGDANDQDAFAVRTDGLGNVIVVGQFGGTVDFGDGILTSGGGLDVFVAKFDPNGGHLWSRGFGAASSQGAHSVALDASGKVIVTGSFWGTIDFGGGPLTSPNDTPDIFVAKLDAEGTHLWSQRFGDGDHQYCPSVITDSAGNPVITGWFFGSVDFGGGWLTVPTGGYCDIFVAKFDTDGHHLWSKRFGGLDCDSGSSVAADGSGNLAITGEFRTTVDFGGGPMTSAGSSDIFVAKFDAGGNHLWSRRFGDADSQGGFSLAADGSGNVIVTGALFGTVDFGGGPLTSAGNDDIFVAKFDTDGNHLWSQRFGDADRQYPTSVAAHGSDVVVTGSHNGTMDFGGGPLTSAGGTDIFVAKFTETPLPVLITSFEAKSGGGTVEVTWEVWSDEPIESFTLYRRDDAHPQSIVIAEGPFEATTRSYIDSNVEPGKTYHYELLIHTTDGQDIRSQIATVAVPRFESTLAQNFPNPFTPSTTIEYTLSERSSAVLGIYDAVGRLVARLDEGVREAGTYQTQWNGRDARGQVVGSGVYFYRLEGAPRVATRKMVLMR